MNRRAFFTRFLIAAPIVVAPSVIDTAAAPDDQTQPAIQAIPYCPACGDAMLRKGRSWIAGPVPWICCRCERMWLIPVTRATKAMEVPFEP